MYTPVTGLLCALITFHGHFYDFRNDIAGIPKQSSIWGMITHPYTTYICISYTYENVILAKRLESLSYLYMRNAYLWRHNRILSAHACECDCTIILITISYFEPIYSLMKNGPGMLLPTFSSHSKATTFLFVHTLEMACAIENDMIRTARQWHSDVYKKGTKPGMFSPGSVSVS